MRRVALALDRVLLPQRFWRRAGVARESSRRRSTATEGAAALTLNAFAPTIALCGWHIMPENSTTIFDVGEMCTGLIAV
jgi:hypothetical protein